MLKYHVMKMYEMAAVPLYVTHRNYISEWLLFPSMSQIAVLKHRSMKCLRQVTEQKQKQILP